MAAGLLTMQAETNLRCVGTPRICMLHPEFLAFMTSFRMDMARSTW